MPGGGEDAIGGDFVGVWSIDAKGDAAPEWTVGKGILKQMRGLTLDPANKTVIVSDKYYNGVLTFALPEMFTVAVPPTGAVTTWAGEAITLT